jgi:hypothetical protein
MFVNLFRIHQEINNLARAPKNPLERKVASLVGNPAAIPAEEGSIRKLKKGITRQHIPAEPSMTGRFPSWIYRLHTYTSGGTASDK